MMGTVSEQREFDGGWMEGEKRVK